MKTTNNPTPLGTIFETKVITQGKRENKKC